MTSAALRGPRLPSGAAWPAGHLPVATTAPGSLSSTAGHGIAAIRLLLPATRSPQKNNNRAPVGTGPIWQGKVNSNMANSFLYSGLGTRIARVGAIAATVALGGAFLLNAASPQPASAQAKKDAKAADPKAAAAKPPEGSWVKLCDKQQQKGKDKDGKEVTRDIDACVTLTEQIHPESGVVMVSAKYHQVKIDGQEKQSLQLTVPLGVVLPFGAGVTVFPKDLWEKLQKNEKIEKADEEKLKAATIPLTYTFCGQAGCNAEVEGNADLLGKLKAGAGFVVQTAHVQFGRVAQPVSLSGFPQALSNPPTDTAKFAEARKQLMQQIYEHRKTMIEEYKKKQDELNKMQPNVAPPGKK
jgi:invasion protein IalB